MIESHFVAKKMLTISSIFLLCYFTHQMPTIHDMHPQEKSFALKVEEMLKATIIPEDRQLMVEVRKTALLDNGVHKSYSY